MLWSVLIIILLLAIGIVFLLHKKQEQDWERELVRLKRGRDFDENPDAAYELTEEAKTAGNKTIARLRLLAAQHDYKKRTQTLSDDSSFSPSSLAEAMGAFQVSPSVQEDAADPSPAYETSSETDFEPEYLHEPEFPQTPDIPPKKVRPNAHKPEQYPEIVPFETSDTPEYTPGLVTGGAFEEITLEEATRSLTEAAVQEWEEHQTAKQNPVAITTESEPEIRLVRTSVTPMKGLEVIDFNDPVLRRTRERVKSYVDSIHLEKAGRPHIETAQTALRTAERESIPSTANYYGQKDEINVIDIQNNLAMRRAARDKLAAAVAPVRGYQPQIIEDEDIFANLKLPANRRRTLKHSEAAAEKITRRQLSQQEAESVEQSTAKPTSSFTARSQAPVLSRKAAVPAKLSRAVRENTFISRPPAPDATVIEPPPVPPVPAPAVDIPKPPKFDLPENKIDIPEPPVFRNHPSVSVFESEVNAHISNNPEISIHDYLIRESASDTIKDVDSETDNDTADVFGRDLPHEQTSSENIETNETPWFDGDDDWDAASDDLTAPQTNSIHLPTTALLLPPQFDPAATQTEEELLNNSITIEEKLAEFKVKVKVVDSYSGPVITRYEIEPDVGVRGNSVINLEKDLARSLGVASIRVVETIPGKTCMGLELPNPKRQMIRLSEIFNSPAFAESKSKLTLALGQDITGQPVVTDLGKAPHLLVAGTTGSGKSVGVNAMILSMLFKATPEDVRMIMIDPKMLELSIYEGIPHLLAPVVTDMKLAANALNWCVNEMEKRYRLMSHVGVRNLAGFNQKIMEAAAQGMKIANPFSLTPDDPEPLEKLPFIVVVVDEFADLMMTAGKKIEELIARLAQKARAAGIHLILATQRPSVDVITGLIKANIPTRIAFQVSSKIDSRTILDQMGAENLLGQGDMLFLPPGTGYPQRVHGAFASDDEVHRVVEYLKQFGEPDYIDDILMSGTTDDLPGISRSSDSEVDPMYDEAVSVVLKTRKASISGIQRQLRIGYNRAARLIDQMEADGIVSPAETNGNRTVLAQSSEHLD